MVGLGPCAPRSARPRGSAAATRGRPRRLTGRRAAAIDRAAQLVRRSPRRSPSSMMNGGASSTWSPARPSSCRPRGSTCSPRSMASALIRRAASCAGSNGSLVARSGDQLEADGTGRGRGCRRRGGGRRSAPSRLRRSSAALVAARWPSRSSSLDRRCTASAAGAGRGVADVGVAVLEEARCRRRSPRRSSATAAWRRSAGSRRPGPWRRSRCRGRCRPARRRTACRCGPCRSSPRRAPAARRSGRRSRGSA